MKSVLRFLVYATFAVLQLAHAAEIVVGQVATLTGAGSPQGKDYAQGLQMAFAAANRAGGANGHTITLVTKDDAGRSEDVPKLTRELLAQNHPIVLAGFTGPTSIRELVASGVLEKERIALVGHRTSEVQVDSPLIFNARASLRDELAKMVEHLATIGITSLAVLHDDGPAASGQVAAIDDLARKAKVSMVARASYEQGTNRVSDAVDALVRAKPQAIILLCSGSAGARFIEQYRANGGAAQLFMHSGADMERVAKSIAQERLSFVTSVMRGVAIAQVVPNPHKTSKLAKELADHAAARRMPVSYVMMEGYITGKVIVEALKKLGSKPTRESMSAALESLGNLDLGGYVVGFKPGVRNGSTFVELSIISDTGSIRQ